MFCICFPSAFSLIFTMTKHELVEYMKNDCAFQHFAHLSCQKSSLWDYVNYFHGFYESSRFYHLLWIQNNFNRYYSIDIQMQYPEDQWTNFGLHYTLVLTRTYEVGTIVPVVIKKQLGCQQNTNWYVLAINNSLKVLLKICLIFRKSILLNNQFQLEAPTIKKAHRP